MADTLRNEVAFMLDGKNRTLRANFTAIRDIESALGKGLLTLLADAGNGSISMTEAATIIHFGLRGFEDTRTTLEEVGEACMRLGFTTASMVAMKFLGVALHGAKPGKPEPETASQ